LLLRKARSAKIGIVFLYIGSLLVKAWRIFNLLYRRMTLARNIGSRLNTCDLYSLDRTRFPSLKEANLAALEWYQKLKDIHEY